MDEGCTRNPGLLASHRGTTKLPIRRSTVHEKTIRAVAAILILLARGRKFEGYPIGYCHIDLADVRPAEGKLYLFVAIDRTSMFAFVEFAFGKLVWTGVGGETRFRRAIHATVRSFFRH